MPVLMIGVMPVSTTFRTSIPVGARPADAMPQLGALRTQGGAHAPRPARLSGPRVGLPGRNSQVQKKLVSLAEEVRAARTAGGGRASGVGRGFARALPGARRP